MKKQLILGLALLVASFGFAQKKELNAISKAIKTGSFAEAKNLISQLEGSISSANAATQAEFYLYKGQAHGDIPVYNEADILAAAEAYKKVIEIESAAGGRPKFTNDAQNGIVGLRVKLVTEANADLEKSKFMEGSKKLYTSYTISPQDTSDLFFAAGYALNGGNYDVALEYYESLLSMKYTGIEKEYTAVNKETQEVEGFSSKQQRDMMVLSGEYIRPAERMTDSRRPDILRNMALMYVIKEDTEKAQQIIDDARKANPNDSDLLRVDADLALKTGNIDKYNSLVGDLISADPNNPDLYLNLGNSASEMGNKEEAIGYYKKALEINPDYYNANINLAITLLEDEGKIIEEMNSLGMSAADNKRYDELREVRHGLYRQALPYFEKAQQLRPNDKELVESLLNLYSQLGEDAKYESMKKKLDAMD